MTDLDPNYVAALDQIKQNQQYMLDELLSGKFETRHPLFAYEGPYPPGPTDKLEGLDRTALEDQYITLFGQTELKRPAARGLTMQADFLASLEKALRARHRGRLTDLVYGAGRARGHTHPSGMLTALLQRLPVQEGI